MRASILVVVSACVALWCGVDSSADDAPANDRVLVATLFDKPIYLDQLTPSEAAEKQRQLPERKYQQWLLTSRSQSLFSKVCAQALHEYAVREKLKPSDDEIDTLISAAVKKHVAETQADAEAQRKLAMQAFWVRASSRDWRTAKALYEKYGGKVAISSFGACQSFEGRNAVLKDYTAAGHIQFHDAYIERAFWEKSKDERIQDVTLQPDRVAQHFALPPWERWIERLDPQPITDNPRR